MVVVNYEEGIMNEEYKQRRARDANS